jgi:hypothetical protein
MALVKIIKGEPVIVFSDLLKEISARTGKSIHDYNKSGSHFDKWARRKGYRGKDPEGKAIGSSQLWYSEYRNDPDGEAKRPLYQNFWDVWRVFAKFKSVGGSKKLVISSIHEKIKKATGKPNRKQVENYEFVRQYIDNLSEIDDQSRIALHRQYHRSHQQDFELAWTEEIFKVIYDLVGEYKNAKVRIMY